MNASINERLLDLVSYSELERRWAAMRKAMAGHGVDAIVVPYVSDPVEPARLSDFLMIACKSGEQTRGLTFAAVSEAQGTLVDVARGSVVDEPALIERRRDGRLGFAALDGFDTDPAIAPACYELPNVLLQPHQGSATVETRIAIGALMIANPSAHFAGQKLPTPVTLI